MYSHVFHVCVVMRRWNFTVGEVDLSLVGPGQAGGGEGEGAEYGGSVPLQVDAAQGVVYGERGGGGGGESRWRRQMSAPITALWVQDGHQLSRINLSSHSILPSNQRPTLLMGEPSH